MRPWFLIMIVAVAVLTSAALHGQAVEREIQTGVKATGDGWAVMAEVTVSIDNLSAANKMMQEAFTKLWAEALAVELTPLGPGHVVVMTMLTGPPQGGELSFEVQLPVIEEPTDEDFDRTEEAVIVPIEASKVAYTYQKGSGADPQAAFAVVSDSFTRLYLWLTDRGHEPTGPPRIIVYGVGETGALQAAELQVPIE